MFFFYSRVPCRYRQKILNFYFAVNLCVLSIIFLLTRCNTIHEAKNNEFMMLILNDSDLKTSAFAKTSLKRVVIQTLSQSALVSIGHRYRVIHFVVTKVNVNKTQNIFSLYFSFTVKFDIMCETLHQFDYIHT